MRCRGASGARYGANRDIACAAASRAHRYAQCVKEVCRQIYSATQPRRRVDLPLKARRRCAFDGKDIDRKICGERRCAITRKMRCMSANTSAARSNILRSGKRALQKMLPVSICLREENDAAPTALSMRASAAGANRRAEARSRFRLIPPFREPAGAADLMPAP